MRVLPPKPQSFQQLNQVLRLCAGRYQEDLRDLYLSEMVDHQDEDDERISRDQPPHGTRDSEEDDRSTPGTHYLVKELLESPAAIQALGLALAPIMEQAQLSPAGAQDRHGGRRAPRGDGPPRACAHTAPGTAAAYGATGAVTGQNLPNAGYPNTSAGIFIPSAGLMSGPNAGYPLVNAPAQQTVPGMIPLGLLGSGASSVQLQPGIFPMPTQPLWGQSGLANQNPSTPSTSSQAINSHEDLVSPFLSSAEDREFRDLESDSNEY